MACASLDAQTNKNYIGINIQNNAKIVLFGWEKLMYSASNGALKTSLITDIQIAV